MLSILISTLALAESTTAPTPAPLDYSICDAYNKLEAATPCGKDGYALNYGLPICKKFVDNEYLFNTKGKAFLDCVRPCLANYVSANITGKVTNCTAIKDAAFKSHVPCYDQCDFCGVVLWNFPQFAVTFKISDFFSEVAIQQVITVATGCLLNPLNFLLGR